MFSSNTSQVSDGKLYIEDVFSTWLYTGNGSTQTITNGIDLTGKGGMLWLKRRDGNFSHRAVDTVRGNTNGLNPNTANSTIVSPIGSDVTGFTSTGFTLGPTSTANVNTLSALMASWTFRKAPKFFDVVTYSGTGTNLTIPHNLGVAPGCILVKSTNQNYDWQVYHRSISNTEYMVLNSTAAKATASTRWNNTTATATHFSVGTDLTLNRSDGTYVAYLFAHDVASEGMIQCGSYVGNGSATGPIVNLGWEPQWLMVKNTNALANWMMTDVMRGMPFGANSTVMYANQTNLETSAISGFNILPNGFQPNLNNAINNSSGVTYIYVAIRRGPMKTPTLGTSVFAPVARSGGASRPTSITTSFPVDAILFDWRTGASASGVATSWFVDKLSGPSVPLITSSNVAQGFSYTSGAWPSNTFQSNSQYNLGTNAYVNSTNSTPYVDWVFRRAPSFFDQVCYTGTGAGMTLSHSLGVSPELVIIKKRSASGNWFVSSSFTPTSQYLGYFNFPSVNQINTYANVGVLSSQPTNAQFVLTSGSGLTDSGATYVAYLYASCPGVSKIGSYTGNGSNQTINCGFAAGARFVMIKRTDSTGDWYVWDTARGIVAGNDPHLSLNTNADEVTTDDTIGTNSSGFVVNQVAATNVNVSSATYIYLAIA